MKILDARTVCASHIPQFDIFCSFTLSSVTFSVSVTDAIEQTSSSCISVQDPIQTCQSKATEYASLCYLEALFRFWLKYIKELELLPII